MELVRIDLRKVATVSAVLTLVTFALIMFVLGFEAAEIGESMARGGAALSVTGVFWSFYGRRGWRMRPLRLFNWLSPYPDLGGGWEGTVCRNRDDTPHPFVLEISQSFASMSFRTFTRRSRGHSTAVWLTSNDDRSVFGAVGIWQTTTRDRNDPTREETFSGTSVWRIELTDNAGDTGDTMRIVDDYYTSRDPATFGRVEVRRVSRTIRNTFQ